MAGNSPKAQQIGAELTRAREAAGLSLRALAARLGYSPSTVSRWENGERFPKPRFLAQYLGEVGAPAAQLAELVELAQEPDGDLWLAVGLPEQRRQLEALLEIERTAAHITTVSPLLVPGLLQTGDYAREIMIAAQIPDAEINTRVSVRLGRRESLIRRNDSALLRVYLWEPVLRQRIGNPDVMREQLQALLDFAELPNVDLRVIQTACPWNAALEGPWSLIDFSDRDSVVHLENRVSGLFVQQPKEVVQYQLAATTIESVAMSPQDSAVLIDRVINGKEAAP